MSPKSSKQFLLKVFLVVCVTILSGVSSAQALTLSSTSNPEIFSDSPSPILIKAGDEFRVDFEADANVSWKMTFSANGAADTTATNSTNPYLTVTAENSASVIGSLQAGDVKITVTADNGTGAAESISFTVTTVNAHGITGTNTIIPDMSTMSSVELTSDLVSRLRAELPSAEGYEIYSLLDEEGVTIDSSERSLTAEDTEEISDYSARMLFALPRITVSKSGFYVFCTSFQNYYAAGAPLQCLFNLGGTYVPFNKDGYMLDEDEQEDGHIYYTIPVDQYVVTAAYFEAGQTYWGYFVAPAGIAAELPVVVIEPVSHLSPDVLQNIANAISIDAGELKLLTAESLSDPQESTKSMRDEAAKDRYELAYKMDTVTVSEDGYYVFAVNLPDEFLSKDIDSFKFYAFDRSIFSGSSFKSSILGLVNGVGTLSEFNMMGLNIDSPVKKMLVVGFFQAGQPLCMYIARLILFLLGLPGCNFASLAGAGIFSLGTAGVFIFMRHQKLRRK